MGKVDRTVNALLFAAMETRQQQSRFASMGHKREIKKKGCKTKPSRNLWGVRLGGIVYTIILAAPASTARISVSLAR